MNISYDHYRVFYYVAKYASFTKAAEFLLNNQPNLTRTVKSLENALGCTLFIRSNKGVRLTDEGQKLYTHIAAAIAHIQAGEEEISLNKSLEKGIVLIGATEIALRIFLLPILSQYRKRYPGIRIKIANVSTPQALSMLENGLLDLAVVSTPMQLDDHFRQKKLTDFREVAICGEAFRPLAEQTAVSLETLCAYPMISMGTRSSTYEFYFRLFAQQGCSFAPDVEAATADQILPMVAHDLGIGFVPEGLLSAAAADSPIYTIPLAEPIPQRSLCLVKLRGHALSLPARELERMLVK